MKKFYLIALGAVCGFSVLKSQAQTTLTLDLTKPGVTVSPTLYGLMTEEINYSYDGGLYGELIRNRIFKNDPAKPEAWSVVQDGGAKANIKLIGSDPENVPPVEQGNAINGALTTCLRLIVEKGGTRSGIANTGYWGIPVKPATTYKASFYVKGGVTGSYNNPKAIYSAPYRPAPSPAPGVENDEPGPITVSIESNDGKIVYASGTVYLSKSIFWKKYELKLTTAANVKPTTNARFVISTNRTGIYYFNLVSLFPPTYNNRPNGNRKDIMKLMADMKPTFLRFPGGNFLEGNYLNDLFPWKTTLGPLEERPGHPGSWQYRASDGLGLLEFLEWCEDLHIEPLLCVYGGYSLKGDHVNPGPLLKPYVDDALDEIEYVTGSVNTKWGAKRAADGHPAPFKLTHIEIGNEDNYDRQWTYDARFNQFRTAIKKKYPNLRTISTVADTLTGQAVVTNGKAYMVDEHYYRRAWQMEEMANWYDSYDRKTSPKIFVGEWATREGAPTTNLDAALGDAAFMTGMERNSDLVLRSCYAPLFVNVNPANPATGAPAGMQWPSNLIGYDGLTSYGSPSYYAQKMFNTNLGNKVVPMSVINLPMQKMTARDTIAGIKRGNTVPRPERPALYYVATKDTRTGTIYLKVVNISGIEQPVALNLKGATGVSPNGTVTVLKGASLDDTNTITDPEHVVPVTAKLSGIGKTFNHRFDPYSITVVKINTIGK